MESAQNKLDDAGVLSASPTVPPVGLLKSADGTLNDTTSRATAEALDGDLLSNASIRSQLENILKSTVFVRSERLSRFLRFVVEQSLAGQGGQLKEYVIGVEAYGRDKSFDPTLDSIVRVEARRLRVNLDRFYETVGKHDPVAIEIPKGCYAPTFRRREPQARRQLSPSSEPNKRALAVLPFENFSSNRDQDYFCDGITEELINALTRLEGIRVVARTSAFAFKGTREDIRAIGEQLNVGSVVEGSVQRSGDRLRITAQLVNVADGYHLWSERYDREAKNIFAIQDEITRAVVKALRVRLPGGRSGLPPNGGTDSLEAHHLFLKGLYHWNKQTQEGIARGCEYFERAVENDPNYVPALVGVSDCYRLLGFWGLSPPRQVMPKAKAAALRAMTLDDTESGARRVLAAVKGHSWKDWPGSEEEYVRAIRLNPGDAITHLSYAVVCLAPMGRLDDAVAHMETANTLDPVSPFQRTVLGWMCYLSRRYDQAIKHAQQALDLTPYHLAYLVLGWAYEQHSMPEEAVAALEKAQSLAGDAPLVLGSLGHAYARSGNRPKAKRLLHRLRVLANTAYVPPLESALVYAGLGEKDKTLEWLDKAYLDHTPRLILAGLDPRFDRIRADPRFTALFGRMGLSAPISRGHA